MDIILCELGVLMELQIKDVLEQMGYTIHAFTYDTDNYDCDQGFFQAFLQVIKEKKYEFVFSVYFLPLVSKVCQIYDTVYISWVYDFPALHLYAKAIQNPVNRIFVFDQIQYERFHAFSPSTIFYMPLATNPMTEEQMLTISLEEKERYNHDVCFVGSMYNEKNMKFYQLFQLPEYWKGYVQGIAEAQLNVYGYNFIADSLTEDAVLELKKLLGYVLLDDYRVNDRELIADMYIGQLCIYLERERTLRALSEKYDVAMYTKSNIEHLPNITNKGLAEPIHMAPQIYHCSKINLHMTPKTIQSGISLRVFDVLGSKGFLIANYQKEICDYFEPGVDLVVYDSLPDLERKVAYYLEHEDERRQIAENGYRKVCESFTYDIAIREILDISGCKTLKT